MKYELYYVDNGQKHYLGYVVASQSLTLDQVIIILGYETPEEIAKQVGFDSIDYENLQTVISFN